MKKRILSAVLSGLLMLASFNTAFASSDKGADEESIKVIYNGEKIKFDQEPVIENNRTLVPVRAICDAIGADLTWDSETQSVYTFLDGKAVVMQINSKVMFANNIEIVLDTAPQIRGNRTLVPVRALTEGYGCTVEWDASTRTVIITK